MKTIYIFLLIISLSSCSPMNEDLNSICVEAEKIHQNNDLNNSEKINQFYSAIRNLELKNETRKFVYDLAHQSNVSYQDFLDFAQEHQLEDWQCSALKELMSE